MDWTKKSRNNFVFLVHFLPAFFCSWENFEVPELVISKWLEHRHIEWFSLLSIVLFDLSLHECIGLLLWCGWYCLFLLNSNWIQNSSCSILYTTYSTVSCSHDHRWVWSSTSNSSGRSEWFILEIWFHSGAVPTRNAIGHFLLLNCALKIRFLNRLWFHIHVRISLIERKIWDFSVHEIIG